MEDNKHKTDAELLEELQGLVAKIPALQPKLASIREATSDENIEANDSGTTEDESRTTH